MASVLSPTVVILVFSVLSVVVAAALAFFLISIIRPVSLMANQRLGILLVFVLLPSFL